MAIELCGPDKRTVCELNCRLLNVEADSQASAPGLSYPDVQVQPPEGPQEDAQGQGAPVFIKGHQPLPAWLRKPLLRAWAACGPLRLPFNLVYYWLLGYGKESLLRGTWPPMQISGPAPLAWHPQGQLLAVASKAGAVLVYDMPGAAAGGQIPSNGQRHAMNQLVQQPRCVLQDALQPETYALAWRPCRGAQLAVGIQGGVALWSTSAAGRPPLSSRSAGGKGAGPWMTLLRSKYTWARFTAVSWSPDGRLLAAASPDMPGVSVWDVAAGICTQVGSGLAAMSLLRWSPCGSYLFGASGVRFHLWETDTWNGASWDVPHSYGSVVQAAWAPSLSHGNTVAPSTAPCRVLLMSFQQGAGQMVALHLVKEPPSLLAQLMPVVIPDISLRSNEAAAEPSSSTDGAATAPQTAKKGSAMVMHSWDWDPTGERLAVLLPPPHVAAGCVALYATSVEPVVSARLLGYARPPIDVGFQEARHQGSVTAAGVFPRGALFTVRANREGSSDEALIYTLPCYFRNV